MRGGITRLRMATAIDQRIYARRSHRAKTFESFVGMNAHGNRRASMPEQQTADQMLKECPDCHKEYIGLEDDNCCPECFENFNGMTIEELIGE
jgi:hypothetical protein